MSDGTLSERITFRAPPALYERMAKAGAIFGGSPSERIRFACYVADCMATIAWLDLPEAAAELGDGLDAAREQAQADLESWLTLAFNQRRTGAAMN